MNTKCFLSFAFAWLVCFKWIIALKDVRVFGIVLPASCMWGHQETEEVQHLVPDHPIILPQNHSQGSGHWHLSFWSTHQSFLWNSLEHCLPPWRESTLLLRIYLLYCTECFTYFLSCLLGIHQYTKSFVCILERRQLTVLVSRGWLETFLAVEMQFVSFFSLSHMELSMWYIPSLGILPVFGLKEISAEIQVVFIVNISRLSIRSITSTR